MNAPGLRVLLLADTVAFHTERFARELAAQGCEVLTASLEQGEMEHHHLAARIPIKPLHYVSAVPQLRALISSFRPDIINPHFASGYGFIAALARHGRRPPIVLNLWGSDILVVPHKSWLHKSKTRYALKAVDYLIGDSEYLVAAAERLVPSKKQAVIPWGIERHHLKLHKPDYGFQKPLRIIVPRTQAAVYNNEFIVRSLRPLLEAGSVAVTFPSFGAEAASFRELVSPYLGGRVDLYERMPREQFLAFMAEHDVYLSAACSDSSPASLIEAMALGLLPVAADIPGVREWLSDESGRLYQQDNETALRAVIIDMIQKGDTTAAVRRANFERVKCQAVFEDNVAAELAIMKSLVERSHA